MDYSVADLNLRYDLKEQINEMNLESVYRRYIENIRRNYLNTFTVVHLLITIGHALVIFLYHKERQESYDVYFYVCGAVMTCFSIRPFMHVNYTKSHRGIPFIVSWIAALLMAFTDIFANIFYETQFNDYLRVAYSGYVLSAVYLFMPLPGYLHPFILGVCITIAYSVNIIAEAVLSAIPPITFFSFRLAIADILYLVALNFVGLYVRRRHEIATRSVFLSKRQRLEQTLYWNLAKAQQKSLLVSMIPVQIANKLTGEIEERIEKSLEKNTEDKREIAKIARKVFIESHTDVTIIFADIVNYTFLTTRVDVKTLVETLHELFHKFDQACEEYNITPIKFLGDCYYAVSGIPISHPLHSVCCIEFGLSIITHIREVRTIKKLDIDMRIGVHSGSLLAGIIGASKWQYDIWSIDVDIANRLEATGMPGRVHISNNTLSLAQDFYVYENGTEKAKLDPVLMKNNIKTFLIIEKNDAMFESPDWQNYRKFKEESQNKERTASTFVSYQDIIEDANKLMKDEVDKLPICKIQFLKTCFVRRENLSYEEYRESRECSGGISPIFLIFDDFSTELHYLTSQPTSVFVLPVMVTSVILICIILTQSMKDYIQEVFAFWLISGFMLGMNIAVLILLIITYTKREWIVKHLLLPYPNSLLNISGVDVLKMLIYHELIYLSNMTAILIVSYVHAILCDASALENDFEIMLKLVEEGERVVCFNAWSLTQSLCLFVALSLIWPRTSFVFSLTISVSIIIINVIMVYIAYPVVYESSVPTTVGLTTEFVHVFSVVVIWVIYLLMARHITYVSKNNYYNQRLLKLEIQKSKTTSASIKALLRNMLPAHVVDVYLKHRVSHEPYYEHHRCVAVMFATVIPNEALTMDLGLMNDIICHFDEILNVYKGSMKIEKIKIVNGTYMAACGLSSEPSAHDSIFLPGKKGLIEMRSTRILRRIEDVDVYNFGPRRTKISTRLSEDSESSPSWVSGQSDIQLDDKKQAVVHRMACFALELLKTVQILNAKLKEQRALTEPPLSLRVGISSGEVAAGIVGYSTSHYDIWGNAVNMASRMDTTGLPNCIQICEETAEILRTFDIECVYRGMTYIKSLGELPTYFIEIDQDLNFVYNYEESQT